MLARIRDRKDQEGFTLIELLVVMIIIGILAAIAIPIFLNQRKKANDSAIKSDLRTAATEVESAFVNTQVYPASGAVLTGAPYNVKTSPGVSLAYTLNAGGTAYCIVGTSDTSNAASHAWVYVSSAGGQMADTVTACPASY